MTSATENAVTPTILTITPLSPTWPRNSRWRWFHRALAVEYFGAEWIEWNAKCNCSNGQPNVVDVEMVEASSWFMRVCVYMYIVHKKIWCYCGCGTTKLSQVSFFRQPKTIKIDVGMVDNNLPPPSPLRNIWIHSLTHQHTPPLSFQVCFNVRHWKKMDCMLRQETSIHILE